MVRMDATAYRPSCWIVFLGAALAVQPCLASVDWDPVAGSTAFENLANWNAGTYTPVPPAGNESAPPGDDSIFFIAEGNHNVILTDPRDGTGGTRKLGTFAIGAGTYAPGTPDVTTGPGNEIMTLRIRHNTTFTLKERDATAGNGSIDPDLRPIRIGRVDQQPPMRGDGDLNFPWGVLLHQGGKFTLDASVTGGSAEMRIQMNDNVMGGGMYEISGTASLSMPGKVRIGNLAAATTAGPGIFRVRGSTMGGGFDPTNASSRHIVADDFEIDSRAGLWDIDRPAVHENRIRFNRGKAVLEFAIDRGGVTPLIATDALSIGATGVVPTGTTPAHPDGGTTQYAPAFLRIKLTQPLAADTPGMPGKDPLYLIWSDRITTSPPAGLDPGQPLQAELLAGRFFDPDHDGAAVIPDPDPDVDTAPHRFLPSGGTVTADYAGASYNWTIQYFEDASGADNQVIGSYVRLVNGVLTGTLGDLNHDTFLNDNDRQALIAAIASPPVTRHQMLGGAQNLFDLNADDVIDNSDLAVFNSYILVPPAGVDGDYNNDGKVDAADYLVWRKYVGTSNTLPHDPIGGPIDVDQYNQWKTNFGKTAAGLGSSFGGTTVPEPGTIMLVVAGLVAAARIRRRYG
jgi:hypothetical protein